MARIDINKAGVDKILHDSVKALLTNAAKVGADGARRRAPVDTGQLRDSIEHGYDEATNTAWYGASAEHAGFVELGTRYMAPQPYLRPAMDDIKRVVN